MVTQQQELRSFVYSKTTMGIPVIVDSFRKGSLAKQGSSKLDGEIRRKLRYCARLSS